MLRCAYASHCAVLFWQIVKKLDYLALKEELAKSSQQAALVSNAASSVQAKFMADKDLQAKALSEVRSPPPLRIIAT